MKETCDHQWEAPRAGDSIGISDVATLLICYKCGQMKQRIWPPSAISYPLRCCKPSGEAEKLNNIEPLVFDSDAYGPNEKRAGIVHQMELCPSPEYGDKPLEVDRVTKRCPCCGR
jgi:hypothetical protein